jgi:hypothetical protein
MAIEGSAEVSCQAVTSSPLTMLPHHPLHALVGAACSEWTGIEEALRATLRDLYCALDARTRAPKKSKHASDLLKALTSAAQEPELPDAIRIQLENLVTSAARVCEERNHIVHGRWYVEDLSGVARRYQAPDRGVAPSFRCDHPIEWVTESIQRLRSVAERAQDVRRQVCSLILPHF